MAGDLRRLDTDHDSEICYITWVPDSWSLLALREAMNLQGPTGRRRRMQSRTDRLSGKIKKIIYPGYGLSRSELRDLEPAVAAFSKDARLISFEEHWQSVDWKEELRDTQPKDAPRLLVSLATESAAADLQPAGLG
ncbi:MAG: hypothetical protein ACK559_11275, partial [bacterium]